MARLLLRGSMSLQVVENPIIPWACNVFSRAFRVLEKEDEMKLSSVTDKPSKLGTSSTTTSSHGSGTVHLCPLLPSDRDQSRGLDIELVNLCLWRVSSSLLHEQNGKDHKTDASNSLNKTADDVDNHYTTVEDDAELDHIEDMRLRGNLFYKLDRNSLEFEEYNVNFRKKHSPKKSKTKQVSKSILQKESSNKEESNKKREKQKESDNKEESNKKREKQYKEMLGRETSKKEDPRTHSRIEHIVLSNHEKNSGRIEETSHSHNEIGAGQTQVDSKKKRSPTYNQLTGPYHEPFCLDIYISKSSVRACIVHRVTSKVVAVAHSISKDMKYDLASTKDTVACTAVGGVLAQRAISDDIYNVVYTPRKGERVEGKLEVVLQSIINNGINVNVKIKQRKGVNIPASTAK